MITAVESINGAKTVTVAEVQDGRAVGPKWTLAVSTGGLDLRGTAVEQDAPLPVLKLPHKDGATWEKTISVTVKTPLGSRDQRQVWKYKAYGPEEVTVQAGKFKTIRVEATRDDEHGNHARSTKWYAPGVGVVKEVYDVPMTSKAPLRVEDELKSFTPAKE